MENNSGQFKRFVMSFSYKERRARELSKYKQRVHELENMDANEIEFEYITLKLRYDHKKSILSIFLISIVLAILMNIWKYFFLFINKALQYAASPKGNEAEIATVSFAIAVIVAVFITLLCFVILGMYMKDQYRIHHELMIVESVRSKQTE